MPFVLKKITIAENAMHQHAKKIGRRKMLFNDYFPMQHKNKKKQAKSMFLLFIQLFICLFIYKLITILCLSLKIQLFCGKEFLNLKSFWIFYISFDFVVMHSW